MNDMISKLSIIENMMKETNFVLEFHKETPMERVVTERWKEIQQKSDPKDRAIAERAFYKEYEIPFYVIVAIIVKQLCKVAGDEGMPLCSCEGNKIGRASCRERVSDNV